MGFATASSPPFGGVGPATPQALTRIVKKCPNAIKEWLVSTVIGRANSHGSMKNRKAAAGRPIKFGIQAGICCEQRFYDFAVESKELAVSASGGRGRIRRAGE